MGMSSSQARLLSLTARMHDIELRAQRIQAEKLRLANESDKVYEDYILALDAKKLQYRSIGTDGMVTFRDATMNALQNGIVPGWSGGDTCQEVLFLQDTSGKVYVTPYVASKYGLTDTESIDMSMDDYLTSRGHSKIVVDEIYETQEDGLDYDKVVSVPLIANTVVEPSNTHSHTDYSGYVANAKDGKYDPSELTAFATFNTSPSDAISSASIVITDASQLSSLNDYTGTVMLANDITISGNWSGITNFQGTFNGNGHTVKIDGTNNTQGLFATTSGATIKNVKVEVGDNGINGGSKVGALVGYASGTDIQNCCSTGGNVSGSTQVGGLIGSFYNPKAGETTIYNVSSTCDVSGSSELGGLMGRYYVDYDHGAVKSNPHFDHAFATGDVSGSSNIGGLVGYYYCDPDKGVYGGTDWKYTDVSYFFAGGHLSGSSNVGGLAGYINGYSDYEDVFRFYNIVICTTLPAYSEGGSIGLYIGENSNSGGGTNQFINSSFGVGINPDYEATTPKKFIGKVTSGDSNIPDSAITDYAVYGRLPDLTDAFISNIEAVFIKAGKYDPCHPDADPSEQTDMQNMIKLFLNKFGDNATDNQKLWFINDAIGKYLTDTGAGDLGDLLYKDVVESPGTSATIPYQSGTLDVPGIKRGSNGDAWAPTHVETNINGEVTIPSKTAIIDEIYYTLKKSGDNPDKSKIQAYFNKGIYDTNTHEGKARLACINDMIQEGKSAEIYYSYILPDAEFTSIGTYTTDYNISIVGGTIEPTYEKKYKDVLVDTIYDWDTTDSSVLYDMAMWRLAQKGIKVVTDAQASSVEYLRNYIENGFAVLITFEPSNSLSLKGLPSETIKNMTDQQYDDLMGIVNTSIAVNTSVQEVANETNVKKAEADYEAKMRRINQKDARCDQKLSVCETERQAIKEEMETLKTVIKNNVEMNFKLFS